jgi:type II secretion system protein I
MNPTRAGWFTLIEVLIALVILATALTLGLGSVQRSAQTLSDLETRLLAHWTAQNALVEQLLAATAPGEAQGEPGEKRATVTQYGESFVVATRLMPGTDSAPGSVSVQVFAPGRPTAVLAGIEAPVQARP